METIRAASVIESGVAARTLPGQTVSGDMHLIMPFANGVLLAVVDGLGHGGEATIAAKNAIATLAGHAHESVISLAYRCNAALIRTRGVVMTVASLSLLDDTVTWMGIGNVEGRLLRADPGAAHSIESVLLRGGVVGYQMPTLQASVLPVERGDVLVFATDGIRARFAEGILMSDSARQIADRVLNKHFKGNDDALVLVARYLGTRHG